MIKIGHARISENKSVDGLRGDQTKTEVVISEYYNKPWGNILRAKNPEMAKKIAESMVKICDNDNIGYGQHFRNDIIIEGEKVDWDFDKISKPINSDCSSSVTACVISAGIPKDQVYKSNNAMTTRNMKSTLEKTDEFESISDKKYIADTKNLRVGDILLAEGSHVAVVVEVDEPKAIKSEKKEAPKENKDYFPAYEGTGVSIINALNELGCKDWSKLYRSKLAVANGICKSADEYIGSAEQNLELMRLVKAGNLKRV